MRPSFFLIFLCLFPMAAFCQQIKHAKLTSESPIYCPIGSASTITVKTPFIPEGLFGIGFVSEQVKTTGDYVLFHEPGTHFISVAPKHEKAPPRNLNVIGNDETYVLIFFVTNKLEKAQMSLILEEIISTGDGKEEPVTTKKSTCKKLHTKPNNRSIASNPAQLIGLIDSVKLIGSVDADEKESLLALMNHLEFNLHCDQKTDFGTHIISLDKVIRHKKVDALCFEISIQNLKKDVLTINPESFTVRVGNAFFKQITSDSPVIIAPNSTHKAYFVVCGDGEGSRNWLSVNNRFEISVEYL